MKNRIFWVFESDPSHIDHPSFAAAPWALFGALGRSEREAMEEIWNEAYIRTQAQISGMQVPLESLTEGQSPSAADIERFKRLLADFDDADFYADA